MIGWGKIVPSRMLGIVPLGDRHICLRWNSLTRASSGVIVAHFTATPYWRVAFAESIVIWSPVISRDSMLRSKYFRSMSRYGRMRVSRIFCQMMRVISSPSISTTGVFTLILDIYSPAGTRTKLLLCSVQALTARFMRLFVQAFLPFVPFVLFVGSPVVAPRPRQNKLRILDRIVVQYVRGVPAMTRHVVTFALVTMFAASATAVLDAQRGGASM